MMKTRRNFLNSNQYRLLEGIITLSTVSVAVVLKSQLKAGKGRARLSNFLPNIV